MRYLTILALAACKGDDSAAGDTDPAGDADTDTDTDADSDTDADTDVPDPCEFAIPANAEVVNGDTSRTDDGAVLWVCRNNTLSYSGDGATIYLEQRADLVINGTGNTIYAVTGAAIHNFGDANAYTVGDPGDVVDEADVPATVEECPNLHFDYSAAPAPGC
jgi:hypothetical protein